MPTTIGLFVDAENKVSPSALVSIIQNAQSAGSIIAITLFGNWNSPALTAWREPKLKEYLNRFGTVWAPTPVLRPGKNAADIALTYEACLLANSGLVNEMWLVSGDSDFTPLVERLAHKGIKVIVFGPETTPLCLRKACHSFVLLADLAIDESMNPVDAPQGLAREGWLRGFVKFIKGGYGFIQIAPQKALFFCANTVDAPLRIQDLREGDQVEFMLGKNHKGSMAIHVRKIFALRIA